MATDSDALDDIFSDDVVKNARPAGKFQPRSKVGPKKKKPAATSVSSSRPVQTVDTTERESNEPVATGKLLEDESAASPSGTVTHDVHSADNSEGTFSIPALPFVENSALSPQFVKADPLTDRECISSRSDGGVSMGNKELEQEEMDVMDSIDFSESITTTTTVQRTGKFKPKVKVHSLKEMHVDPLGSQARSPENDYAEGDSVPAFLDDDILDLSSIEFSPSMPIEPTIEFPSNEESVNPMEMMDSGICSEGGPEVPAKLASRRAKTGRSEAHETSDPPLQGNGSGRVLRPYRNKGNLCEIVDDVEDVVYDVEENINDEQVQHDGVSEVKKGKRKSKKADEDNGQPTKSRKKAKEASDQNAEAKSKKFHHTTRRKRVDKVLLETPEYEIDYSKVPIRDLILFADHMERQTKRGPAAPAIKQSNTSSSAYNDENDDFRSEFGEDDDGEPSHADEESNMLINYQTYMKKTPTIRWSKQDTALFYEGVRQFGTDLSMIQHLFPGRTRQQVKLKYKKEERQHRLRLNEALTSRSKDHSHFKTVIDRLKKIAAEERLLNGEEDDEPVDLTGEEVVGEADETLNVNDEGAKSEKTMEEGNADIEAAQDIEENVEINEKAYDSEDDSFLWGQYQSDI